MGAIMGGDDFFIGSLLEQLNLRFGVYDPNWTDGIDELVVLQKEFAIFKKSRPLWKSLELLGVGGQWNPALKAKWLKLLADLDAYPSGKDGVTGGQAIVNALISHLALDKPGPVYFQAHDSRLLKPGRVVEIQKSSRPLFYIEKDYLTISIPMKPRPADGPPPPPPPPPESPPAKKTKRKK